MSTATNPAAATTATAPRENLLGICHALGQLFGCRPLVLRVLLMLGLLLDAEAAIIAYLACGAALLLASLVAPAPRAAATA